MGSKNQKLNLDRDTLYDLYINKMMTSNEVATALGCSSKSVRNYLALYNIPIRQNGEAVKLERSKWSDDKEHSRSLKFMNTWNNKSEEERREIAIKKTSTPNHNSPASILKSRETKLRNNSYIKSKSEDALYNSLLIFFDKDDIVRGYVDSIRYPFNCDFYIKSKDLFIEYQGHQTHGREPYDPTRTEHQEYLHDMLNRGVDMTTWTTRDVKKLNWAKKSKIKLLLIYPKNDSYLVKDGILNNIGTFNVIDINDIN